MKVEHESCAGLDVHKRTVVACVLKGKPGSEPVPKTKNFGTSTPELMEMVEWLKSHAATHIAMEATGNYWMPVYNLLEGRFELIVANAAHMKAVPGRKTDVADAHWIADLLRHGLLRKSFIPSREQRDLRELTRHRSSLAAKRGHALAPTSLSPTPTQGTEPNELPRQGTPAQTWPGSPTLPRRLASL